MNSLLLQPKILLQQLNVLSIKLNNLLLLKNSFVIPISTNDIFSVGVLTLCVFILVDLR